MNPLPYAFPARTGSDQQFEREAPGGPFTYYSAPWPTAGFPSNPFPSTPPTASTAFVNGNSLPFGGGGIYFVNPHLHTPYAYQYNLSFQHELATNLVAEANYVGSSSKGLTSLEDINPFDLRTVTASILPGF